MIGSVYFKISSVESIFKLTFRAFKSTLQSLVRLINFHRQKITGRTIITITNQIGVESINVSSIDGTTSIEGINGTLQMKAEILPVNAAIREVTWSAINGSGEAIISENGLLTAIKEELILIC